MTDSERRFSLDPIKVDPSLKNRIFSADGDETVGEWNGEKYVAARKNCSANPMIWKLSVTPVKKGFSRKRT